MEHNNIWITNKGVDKAKQKRKIKTSFSAIMLFFLKIRNEPVTGDGFSVYKIIKKTMSLTKVLVL